MNPLKLKLKINQIEFEAEGSPEDVNYQRVEFVEKLLPIAINALLKTQGSLKEQSENRTSEINQKSAADNTPPTPKHGDSHEDNNKLSINEFLNQKGFSSQIDTAIGLIYYYEIVENRNDFSSDDLKQYFKYAKIKIPGNSSDVIAKLIGKSYIMAADEKGRYKLTRTGISFVTEYIAKTPKEKKAKSNRSISKSTSVFAQITADDLHLNKYPEIKKIGNFKDQMMLCLFIVRAEGHGDAFSVQDVQCIMTDILGLPATKDQIQGVFSRNATWFTNMDDPANKRSVKHRLLTGAVDYAQSLITKQ